MNGYLDMLLAQLLPIIQKMQEGGGGAEERLMPEGMAAKQGGPEQFTTEPMPETVGTPAGASTEALREEQGELPSAAFAAKPSAAPGIQELTKAPAGGASLMQALLGGDIAGVPQEFAGPLGKRGAPTAAPGTAVPEIGGAEYRALQDIFSEQGARQQEYLGQQEQAVKDFLTESFAGHRGRQEWVPPTAEDLQRDLFQGYRGATSSIQVPYGVWDPQYSPAKYKGQSTLAYTIPAARNYDPRYMELQDELLAHPEYEAWLEEQMRKEDEDK